jgi:hypothetical protein
VSPFLSLTVEGGASEAALLSDKPEPRHLPAVREITHRETCAIEAARRLACSKAVQRQLIINPATVEFVLSIRRRQLSSVATPLRLVQGGRATRGAARGSNKTEIDLICVGRRLGRLRCNDLLWLWLLLQ